MASRGGEIAAKHAKFSGDANDDGDADADGLSALPDDVLVLILVRLDSAAAAGRTSILSRRWRRLWALLLELRFPVVPSPHLMDSALASHEAALASSSSGSTMPPQGPWRPGSPSPPAASPAA
ncbi:hypothetical protein BAE44_0023849 [Dichanthelium oligosanthes]|uniref:F-box domain-containing protein n=1 Tax=Dichanthelium oligosanthes TaxID=888268 RepID=A0A1E5UQK0_9POAL|nr:hypothetical protein BAE44_0023849 [Dichanthelium oligosanthes]